MREQLIKAIAKDHSNNEVCGSIHCLVVLTLPVFVSHCSLQGEERDISRGECVQREGARH